MIYLITLIIGILAIGIYAIASKGETVDRIWSDVDADAQREDANN